MNLTIPLNTASLLELKLARCLLTETVRHRFPDAIMVDQDDVRHSAGGEEDVSMENIAKLVKVVQNLSEAKENSAAINGAADAPTDVPPPPPTLPVRLPEVEAPAAVYDSAGVAWDANLHSEGQSKLQDGTWRKRRNSGGRREDESPAPVVASIQADSVSAVLVNAGIVPSPPTTDTPPPPASEPIALPPVTTFAELMTRVALYFAQRRIDTPAVMGICKERRISSLQECHKRPDLIPLVCADLDAKATALVPGQAL